jgi:cysteine synthase B
VGNTPLIPLRSLWPRRGVQIWLKAEWFNPGGSVKDRAARGIVQAGLAAGELPGKRLLDASSGNTAVAYSVLGRAAGVGVTICMPSTVTVGLRRLLAAYETEVILTDRLSGTDAAIDAARAVAAEDTDRYWYADQYSNPANPAAHAATTGPELWRQSGGRITHLIAGLGTGGTLMGAGRALRAKNPAVRLVAVEPDGPMHGLAGLKHMATAAHVPSIFDETVPDERRAVRTEDAEVMVHRLVREEGLLVGWSSGAAVLAALEVASTLATGVVVAIAPDGGERYLGDAARRRAAAA